MLECLQEPRLLASGGMSEIYAAHHPRTGEPVAIKRLHPDMAHRTDLRRRFFNEVDLLQRCAGPYVLACIEVGTWRDTPAYIAERCVDSVGGLLKQRELPFPMRRALRYTLEVLIALDRVHALGCVHRDIKPGNVLLAADDSVRLADFGISLHPARRLTESGHRLGTPSWAPAAMIERPASARPADDLYGVGMLLVRMITGLHPRSLTHPIKRERILGALPFELERVIGRATAADPAERYTSAATMLHDLRRFTS